MKQPEIDGARGRSKIHEEGRKEEDNRSVFRGGEMGKCAQGKRKEEIEMSGKAEDR